MAEEVKTTDVQGSEATPPASPTEAVPPVQSTQETTSQPAEATPPAGTEQTQAKQPEQPAGDSIALSDIEWPDELGLDDAGKTDLFNNHKDLFKGKAEVNKYLKSLAEATRINKESQTKKVAELENGWETELKTDADFGKDYDGNKKLVADTMKRFVSEADMQTLEKFGFAKSPALNRMMLKIAKEFEGAKVVKTQQPAPPANEPKKDQYGRTVFDFTKKQG